MATYEETREQLASAFQALRDLTLRLQETETGLNRSQANMGLAQDGLDQAQKDLTDVLSSDIISMEEYVDAKVAIEAERAVLEGVQEACAVKECAVATLRAAKTEAESNYEMLQKALEKCKATVLEFRKAT